MHALISDSFSCNQQRENAVVRVALDVQLHFLATGGVSDPVPISRY